MFHFVLHVQRESRHENDRHAGFSSLPMFRHMFVIRFLLWHIATFIERHQAETHLQRLAFPCVIRS